jgi:hypothetical protein
MVRVVHWNGKDVPEELRDLPVGTYVLESIEDAATLSAEDEDGLRAALASLRAGRGRTVEDVRRTIDDMLAE